MAPQSERKNTYLMSKLPHSRMLSLAAVEEGFDGVWQFCARKCFRISIGSISIFTRLGGSALGERAGLHLLATCRLLPLVDATQPLVGFETTTSRLLSGCSAN